MKQGIEFTLKDGTKDYYDPIVDFTENETEYSLYVMGSEYTLSKDDVVSYRFFDCCDKCGYELPNYCQCNGN